MHFLIETGTSHFIYFTKCISSQRSKKTPSDKQIIMQNSIYHGENFQTIYSMNFHQRQYSIVTKMKQKILG